MKFFSDKKNIKIDPIEWLNFYDIYPKFYWKSKKSNIEIATLGVEREFHDLNKIDNNNNVANCVLSFDLDMKKSRMWIPTFELHKTAEKACFSSYKNTVLTSSRPLSAGSNKLKSSSITPDFKKWKESISESKNKLEKVVLARRHSIFMEKDVDGLFVFSKLKKKCKNTFLFFYQPNPFEFFLGASPEMLFKKTNKQIISESIAGTRKRGTNTEQDFFLKKELLSSFKELKEFNFVRDYIESMYKRICFTYSISKTCIYQNQWIQHLYAKFNGKLKQDFNIKKLIKLFHPTPAIGGLPKKEALLFINNFESFDRLFYSAPIGRASQKEAEFAVGIRSCHIKNNRIDIFSGTGIIDSSNSKDEWNELQSKTDWIFEII